MFSDILSGEQKVLLPYLAQFKREYILVGGTALALLIGHRRSIDFDFFKKGQVNRGKIKDRFAKVPFQKQLLFENPDGIHYLVNEVKVTFFQYPFDIPKVHAIGNTGIKTPDLLTLAAMKFYAMGRRAKWKDYVDIYILLKGHFSIEEVSVRAYELFEGGYSEKLFRQQISYFEDIDYSEPVDWLKKMPDNESIRQELCEMALSF